MQTLIGRFTYGRVPDTEYLRTASEAMHHTGQAVLPGRWMVDALPMRMQSLPSSSMWRWMLKKLLVKWVPSWAPGAGFQRWAIHARAVFMRMTREPFDRVKHEIVSRIYL